MLSFMLIAFFFPITGHHWKSLSRSAFFKHSLQTSVRVGQSQVSLSHLPGKKLHSLNCLSGLLLDSVWQLHVSLHLEAQIWMQGSRRCLTRAVQRGMITSLDLVEAFCLMQPRMSFLGVKDTLLGSCSTCGPSVSPDSLLQSHTARGMIYNRVVCFQHFILVRELKEKCLLDFVGWRERTIHIMKYKWKHNKIIIYKH